MIMGDKLEELNLFQIGEMLIPESWLAFIICAPCQYMTFVCIM